MPDNKTVEAPKDPEEQNPGSTEELQVILEASQKLAETLDLREVLQNAVESILKLVGLDSAVVYLKEGANLRLWATYPPLPPDFPDHLSVAPIDDHPHLKTAMETGTHLLINDLREEISSEAEGEVVRQRGLRTVLYVPMVVDSKAIGALIVGSTTDVVDIPPRRIALSRTLANLAALTARNARLYAELNTYSSELKESLAERIRVEEERKTLQEELLQAQKMESVGRLAGGVAHDFNNMLNVILGYTELAIDKLPSDSPINAYLEEVHVAAKRSAEVTRQLLAFARKQPIAPKIIDLNDAIESMLKMLRRLIGEDIDLRWNPSPEPVLVYMDPTQLDQILANLCINARDALGGKGNLTIETGIFTFDESYCAKHQGFLPGEYSMLAVSDNGKGIEEEQLGNLFDPFYTTKEEGTGLGLATVYGIVRQNNGFINVYSEPGEGTTFKAFMPRKSGTPQSLESPHRGEVPQGAGETLMVVEDDPSILELTQLILQGLGYEVIAVGSPRDAINTLEESKCEIDLLLTDVVMPGMTGKELVKELESRCEGVKVLYMSGYTSNVIAHRGVLDEGVNFLQKPFSREALAIKVRAALGD